VIGGEDGLEIGISKYPLTVRIDIGVKDDCDDGVYGDFAPGDRSFTNPENFGLDESITAFAGNAGKLIAGTSGSGGDGGPLLLSCELVVLLTVEPRMDFLFE